MTDKSALKKEREYWAARLDGYLDAIASMNGKYRDYVTSAVLIQNKGETFEQTIRAHVESWERSCKVTSIVPGDKWTEVENYFHKIFLTEPFGNTELGNQAESTGLRSNLAFQATDMVMFISEVQNPDQIFFVDIQQEEAQSVSGCVLTYGKALLFITHVQWLFNG